MRLFDLTGRTALVTGAGSGIGQAIAIGLAEAGADVACFGRKSRQAGLDETAHRIAAFGRKAIVLIGTVASEEDLASAVMRTEAELGPMTIGINNAGIAHAEPAETLSLAAWNRLYETNVTGVFLSCQAEGRAMLRHGHGAIVNISSISGIIANRGLTQAHYNSSKAAVTQMSKSLAMEWVGRGVRVNALSPGYTMTPMNDRSEVADQLKIFQDDTPMQRIASSDEMVGPAIFLVSQAASFVTGIDLIVDGGFSSW
jgi:NAD(P)-dependent dehydrogenase (short-subunit alcohol dehydrogenase family)